jgi:ketosteroid isomerase-like protein
MPRVLVLGSFVLALAALMAPAAPAHACGGPIRERVEVDPARAVVDAHFAALARGDGKAARALWSNKARVLSYDADGAVATREPVRKALRRWLAARDGLSWQVIEVAPPTTRGVVTVRVEVTWNGATYDDVLTVAPVGAAGALVITTKTSRPRATSAVASPY